MSLKSSNIRLYNSDDLPQIIAIMQEIYDKKTAETAESRWLWQYHESPLAKKNGIAVYVYVQDGEVLSVIGGMRQIFKVGDVSVEGMWLVDFMAKPNTNIRAGMRLAKAVTGLFPLCVGQNSPQLNRYWKFILKGSSVYVGDISEPDLLIKPLTITPALPKWFWKSSLRPPLEFMTRGIVRAFFPELGELNTSYDVKKIEYFDERYNGLWELCANDYKATAIRNQDYLNWRYDSDSGFDYDCFQLEENGELKAWVVGRKYFKDGIWKARIVDYLAEKNDKRSWNQLFLTICEFYRKQNVSLIQMISSREEKIFSQMEANNFKPHTNNERLSPYVATVHMNHKIYSYLSEKNYEWHMSYGDTDLDFY